MNIPTRRDFFKRASLTAAAAALPATAMAFQGPITETPDDPIPDWFREWKRLRAAWLDETIDQNGNDRGEHLWDEYQAIGDRIGSTPAKTREGAATQLEWFASEYQDDLRSISGEGVDAVFSNLVSIVRGGQV